MLWETPIWALPFALFFCVLNGARWNLFGDFYRVALLFTAIIRVMLLAAERLVVPRLRPPAGDSTGVWLAPGIAYAAAATIGAYVAAWLAQMYIWHQFIGGPAGWLQAGMFSLLFSMTFGGLAYARSYYRVAIDRAAQVERIRAELARAELRALRAQVDPHFLFNTLNTIAALIAEDPAAAEHLVTRLADVFRYALASSGRESTRFADERAFLTAYLEIERARFGARLRVEEDIEPGLDELSVPGMLFQPLVENAVRYAVAPRAEGGTIRLRARRDGGSLRVTIADDGPGFAPGAQSSGHGVGLESVRERLRLAGEGHALEIAAREGGGAEVTVRLPLQVRPEVSPAPSPEKEPRPC